MGRRVNTWQCLICGQPFPGTYILDHIRLFHPDLDWEPEYWEDGKPVIYDDLDTVYE